MKKIILVLLILCAAFVGNAQTLPTYPGYTNINSGYQWLRGLFAALGTPAGTSPAFQTGQLPRAGALYYDSTGTDSGFYYYSGLAWRKVGTGSSSIDSTLASQGNQMSGDTVVFAGPIGTPGIFTTERTINTNRLIMHWTNGVAAEAGGAYWQFTKRPYSPFQFISADTLPGDNQNISAARPLSGIFARRTLYYPAGTYKTIESFGHYFGSTHDFQDSIVMRTDGGDYQQTMEVEIKYRPRNNGYSVVRQGFGTGANLRRQSGTPALLARVNFDGKDDTIADTLHINGTAVAFAPYYVAALTNGRITVDNFVFIQPGQFINSTARMSKTFLFAPANSNSYTDSAYGWYDTASTTRSYHAGKYVFGLGAQTATSDGIKLYGNLNMSDSLIVGTQTEVSDTTGYDVVLRRRTDGSYIRIRADLLGVGGTTPGIDDVLAQAQSLTTGRTITTGANVLTITGTPSTTLNVLNSGTGAAIQGAAAGTGNGVYGISDGGPAVRGTSNTGPGLYGTSTDDAAGTLEINPASTNTVQPVLKLFRSTSGTAAAGIGGSIQFINERSNGSTNSTSNEIHSVWTNATDGAQTSQLNVLGVNAAASETFMNIQTGGVVRVNNNADTLATKAYARSVGGSGGGASTALDNLASVAINTSLISDADNTDDLGSSTFAWKDGYLYRVLAQGATSGQVEYKSETNGIAANGTTASGDGVIPVEMKARLTSDFGLADVGTDQTAFPSTIDVITLQGGTVYEFEIYYRITHGNVAVSTATGFTAGGGLTINSITYNTVSHVAAADNTTSASNNSTDVIQLASTVVTASSASTKVFIVVRGEIDVNAGGTLEPIIKFSAAPGTTGSANNMKAGTRYKFTPIGPTGMTKIGNIN